MLHHGRRGILSRGAGGGANPTKSYNGFTSALGTGTSTFSVTGVSLGTAASDRIVAVYIHYPNGTISKISSVTIAGVSATLAVEVNASNQARVAAIYYANITTGTSGTVSVVTNGTQSSAIRCIVASYSLYGLTSSTPTATQVSNNDVLNVSPTRSVTITPSSGGILIAGYNAGGYNPPASATWTNATEDFENEFQAGNIATTASEANLTASSLTVTCTNTDTVVNRPNLILAAWR